MGFFDYFVAEDAYLALAKVSGGLAQGSVTGTTYWVDNSNSNASDTAGRGTFTAPFDTIDYAIGETTADAGDVILVMPGHNENVNLAGKIALDVASTAIVGMGYGQYRPLLYYSAAVGSLDVSAAGCRVENLRFRADSDANEFINVSADGDGFVLRNCWFTTSGAAYEPTNIIILASGATDCCIDLNRFDFLTCTDTSTDCIQGGGGNNRLAIVNNVIAGNWSTAAINLTTSATTNMLIARNYIINEGNVQYGCLKIYGTGNLDSGFVVDNRGYCGNAAALDNANTGVCFCENYFTSDYTLSGTIDPATS